MKASITDRSRPLAQLIRQRSLSLAKRVTKGEAKRAKRASLAKRITKGEANEKRITKGEANEKGITKGEARNVFSSLPGGPSNRLVGLQTAGQGKKKKEKSKLEFT
jgi:hypothetical protein